MNSTLARRPAGAGRDDGAAPAVPPFWQRLNSFFLFPFQLEPLIFGVLLAGASYLLLWPSLLLRFFIALGIVLAASRYAFKVAALASRGVVHSRDYSPHLYDEDWKVLPWKFFGVLVVHGVVIGFLARQSPALGLVGNLVSALLWPATLMVLIQSFSLRAALNPFELMATMADIGKSYWLLCLFLFLLQAGFPQAAQILLPITPKWLLLPALVWLAIYFLWVMASLIGYVMFQHHGELDIALVKEPEAAPGAPPPDPVRLEAARRDATVADLATQGDLTAAIAEAREWARTGHDSLADQRRYHRVLLLDDASSGRLADHSQRYLSLLLTQKRGQEALDVLAAVQQKLPTYAPERADVTLALAQQAWKLMDAKRTGALLKGFDKRYAGAAEIPAAYELIVRVLKQGLSRPDKALPIYDALKRRYPDHPSTQEAAWVLREELGAAA